MIKVLAAFSRKPGWSVDEFLCHYKERHAPLIAGTASFTRFCHRYVQNYPEHHAAGGLSTLGWPCDAISEMWFETVEAMQATYAAADYLERARPDEHRFADFESASVLVLQEQELWRNDTPCVPDKRWAQLPLTKLFVCYSSRNPVVAREHGSDLPTRDFLLAHRICQHVFSRRLTLDVADLPSQLSDKTAGIDEFKFHSMSDALTFADVWTAGATQDDRTGYPEGAEILRLFFGRSHDVFTHD